MDIQTGVARAYLDVAGELRVDSEGPQQVGQGGGAGEGGRDRVGHLRHGEHLEAKLLVEFLQLLVRLLLTFAQDAAHHVATLLSWPLREWGWD